MQEAGVPQYRDSNVNWKKSLQRSWFAGVWPFPHLDIKCFGKDLYLVESLVITHTPQLGFFSFTESRADSSVLTFTRWSQLHLQSCWNTTLATAKTQIGPQRLLSHRGAPCFCIPLSGKARSKRSSELSTSAPKDLNSPWGARGNITLSMSQMESEVCGWHERS